MYHNMTQAFHESHLLACSSSVFIYTPCGGFRFPEWNSSRVEFKPGLYKMQRQQTFSKSSAYYIICTSHISVSLHSRDPFVPTRS